MNEIPEDRGCYQCGSFAGTTFRLCENCLALNEKQRQAIRLRRGTKRKKESRLTTSARIATLIAIIVILGVTAVTML